MEIRWSYIRIYSNFQFPFLTTDIDGQGFQFLKLENKIKIIKLLK